MYGGQEAFLKKIEISRDRNIRGRNGEKNMKRRKKYLQILRNQNIKIYRLIL